jgi:hypothetical protein
MKRVKSSGIHSYLQVGFEMEADVQITCAG